MTRDDLHLYTPLFLIGATIAFAAGALGWEVYVAIAVIACVVRIAMFARM